MAQEATYIQARFSSVLRGLCRQPLASSIMALAPQSLFSAVRIMNSHEVIS